MSFRRWRKKHFGYFRPQYEANGLAVRGRNLGFLDEPGFAAAWAEAERGNRDGWDGKVPDIRWRAHVACWAGREALRLPGDFVECGVHTGLISMTVARYLDFANLDRSFFLFDTFEGIPEERAPEAERAATQAFNTRYFDVFDIARRNFAAFPNARLVRGVLPDTLDDAGLDRIAWASIDLNSAWAEKAVIEVLWDRLSPGAPVVIDDYAFTGHEAQYEMWNEVAAARDRTILSLPTGQGLMFR